MAQKDELLKGIAIGVGAGVLLPVLVTAVAPVVRSLARSFFKVGVFAYAKGREAKERLGEAVDDVVAEVEDELIAMREVKEAIEALEQGEEAATVEDQAKVG